MEYPKYQSHKQVSAVKIKAIDPGADGSLTLHLEGGFDNVLISHLDVHRKPKPSVGWYLVVYEGGYTSFSPAQAFEDGYTRIYDEEAAVQHLGDGPASVDDDDDDEDDDEDDEEILDAQANHGQAAADTTEQEKSGSDDKLADVAEHQTAGVAE